MKDVTAAAEEDIENSVNLRLRMSYSCILCNQTGLKFRPSLCLFSLKCAFVLFSDLFGSESQQKHTVVVRESDFPG